MKWKRLEHNKYIIAIITLIEPTHNITQDKTLDYLDTNKKKLKLKFTNVYIIDLVLKIHIFFTSCWHVRNNIRKYGMYIFKQFVNLFFFLKTIRSIEWFIFSYSGQHYTSHSFIPMPVNYLYFARNIYRAQCNWMLICISTP